MQDQITTSTTVPTLDDLIAQRLDDIARDKAEALAAAQRELEGNRQDQMTDFEVRLPHKIGASLLDALHATILYDRDVTDADGDEDTFRGPCARFTHHDEQWTIRRDRYYGDRLWILNGPTGYHVQLAQDWDWDTGAGHKLLEALAAYPDWLAEKQRRQQEREQEQAAKAADTASHAPTLYAYVAGDDPNHDGMLHTLSRVWLKVETPETGEYGGKTETHRAQVIDWDDHWLLINLDDDETQQRLIPIACVVSIQPRA